MCSRKKIGPVKNLVPRKVGTEWGSSRDKCPWCPRENPGSLSSHRAEISLKLLLSLSLTSTSLLSSSSSSSSGGWCLYHTWCPRENPGSLSRTKAEKFDFQFFVTDRPTDRVTYISAWSRIKRGRRSGRPFKRMT